MEQNTVSPTSPTNEWEPTAASGEPPDVRLHALSTLLENVDGDPRAAETGRSEFTASHQNHLVQVRLGIASSLFHALRAKHPPTAFHSLRVALGCSTWAMALRFDPELLDQIEVAALLHDVGKIGVPDHILLKPGKLTEEEMAYIERHRLYGEEILAACAASPLIIESVHYSPAWYDGSRAGYDRAGDALPLLARMISIVDAFDAMTTDQVYRRAMSRERALAELYACAGTQFDPQLVEQFCALHSSDRVNLNAAVARRWLEQLHPEASNTFWKLGRSPVPAHDPANNEALFYERLTESLTDAVVFVDVNLRILLWNPAAERLTGIAAASVCDREWLPSLVDMHDARGYHVTEDDCPVAQTIRSGVQTLRRMTIRGRNDDRLSIDAQIVPVIARNGVVQGATVVLHDASSQATLEEHVQLLHEKATKDPLTGVANRAEFDRLQAKFVESHLKRRLPTSLIICDIDHFKKINDSLGHQAGDDALITFAGLLKRHCRQGDLVARYGGEEFVMLCADCDNATATTRAEEIRAELAATPMPSLAGKCITASFGVTELQPGDTPETMLRRADRGLLQAKESGRNMVVQLGGGMYGEDRGEKRSWWLSWFRASPGEMLLERTLVTNVPLNVTAEKLRGFMADQGAEMIGVDGNHVTLKIEGQSSPLLRRTADRAVPFFIELTFAEHRELEGEADARPLSPAQTVVHVAIRPRKNRDRRRREAIERARQLLVSLKSYLMAHESTAHSRTGKETDEGVLNKVSGMFKGLMSK